MGQRVLDKNEEGKGLVFDFEAFSRCWRNEEKRRKRKKKEEEGTDRGVSSELMHDIAEAAGCSEETVKGWKSGKHGPSEIGMVEAMAGVLKVEANYLLKEKRAMTKRVIGDAERAAAHKIYTMMYDMAKMYYSWGEHSREWGSLAAKKIFDDIVKLKNEEGTMGVYRYYDEFQFEVEKQKFYLPKELREESVNLFGNSFDACWLDDIVSYYDSYADYLTEDSMPNSLEIGQGFHDAEKYEDKFFSVIVEHYAEDFYKRLDELFADYILE